MDIICNRRVRTNLYKFGMRSGVISSKYCFSNSSVMKYKDVVWLPLTTDKTLKYLKLDNDPAVIDEPFSERMKFWDSLNV